MKLEQLLEEIVEDESFNEGLGQALKDKIDKVIMTPKPPKDFEPLRTQLLHMVNTCKTIEEINYFEQDVNIAGMPFDKMIKHYPEREKDIKEHKKWLDTT